MANMAVGFSQTSPGSYFEVLTKGEPSSFMSEIFKDPNINVFNARNPVVNDGVFDWDNRYSSKFRNNYSNEYITYKNFLE